MVFCQRFICGHTLQRPLYIRGRERVAIVPGDVVAQLEFPGGIVNGLIAFSQHAHPGVVLIGALNQAVAEIAQHRAGDTVVVVLHIKRGDVAALRNRQHFFAAFRRGRRRRRASRWLRAAGRTASGQRRRQHCNGQQRGCKFLFHQLYSSLSCRGVPRKIDCGQFFLLFIMNLRHLNNNICFLYHTTQFYVCQQLFFCFL